MAHTVEGSFDSLAPGSWEETGLKPCCVEVYKTVYDVKEPFIWQCAAARELRWAQGNMILTQPTSAGKTFVIEALLLSSVLRAVEDDRSMLALYVLPYRALVTEKAHALQLFAEHHDFVVQAFQGREGRTKISPCVRMVMVATVEKALRIVSGLLLDSRLGELELLVADELHLLDDMSRGGVFETLLSLVRWHSPDTRIVGLSATLPNPEDICDWLQATLIQGSARPVDLRENLAHPDALEVFLFLSPACPPPVPARE